MKKIKDFHYEQSNWGYLIKRFFAFSVDWYLASVLLNLIVRLTFISLKIGNEFGELDKYDLKANIILIIIPLLVSLIYYVLIPYLGKRKSTLMMKVLRLEFIGMNGEIPSLLSLLKRFYLGSFLLQGVIYSSSNTLIQSLGRIFNLIDNKTIDYFIAISSLIFVLISVYLAIKDHDNNQTLQDRIARIKVVEIEKEEKYEKNIPIL